MKAPSAYCEVAASHQHNPLRMPTDKTWWCTYCGVTGLPEPTAPVKPPVQLSFPAR